MVKYSFIIIHINIGQIKRDRMHGTQQSVFFVGQKQH